MSVQNLLQQTATVYPKSGYDKFGRDTQSAGTTYPCRFQNKTKFLTLQSQQIVELVGTFYFSGEVVVNTEDRIVYAGVNYKAFMVNGAIDGRGNQRLLRVDVQRWQT